MPTLQYVASAIPPADGWGWALLVQAVGFIVAVFLILRMANERRQPSNIFAWSLLLIFAPVIGVPLYLVFGGRKIRRLTRRKLEIQLMAARVAREESLPNHDLQYGFSVFSGNRVTFLKDGVQAYRELCEQIASASHSIHIMTYILGRDNIGRDILLRLADRAREGVKVRLLVDALGSLRQCGRFCNPLREAGGEVGRFIPLVPLSTRTSANLRNHRKIAIFDGRRVIVGGQNIDGRFLADYDHPALFTDFGSLIEGPAVSAFNQLFVGDWAFATGKSIEDFRDIFASTVNPCGESHLQIVASGPDVEGDPLWEQIIAYVQEAQKEVTIVTPYFIPDEVLLQSLIIKAHRGRRIRIIVPERSNHPVVDLARNHYLRRLSANGAEVLFYRPRMLHAKLILVDNQVALTGSANIDLRSLFVNFEVAVVHSSQRDVDALTNWVSSHVLPHCIRYKEHRRSGNRRSRLLAEDLAHLITPLL